MIKSDPTASDIARLRNASEWLQRLNESSGSARALGENAHAFGENAHVLGENAHVLGDEWSQWCRSDPLNLPAFEQMQRIWDAFSEVSDAGYAAPQPVKRLKYRAWLVALAAALVLAVGTAGWFALHYPRVQELATTVGEQRRLDLADGSKVDLAPDSRVTARFTMARREVQLERGQAFFVVAHDAVRPFVVHANSLTVTAVGTAFDVRIGPAGAVVTVGEGRVTVAPGADAAAFDPGGPTGTIRAGVGQRVTYSKSARRLSLATVGPRAAGSWRDGTLQFVGEPLEDVVNAVNRYGVPPIEVAPNFRQTRFTGTVSPANVRDWLNALEQIYAVEVVDQGVHGILIRSRAANGAR